MGRSKEMPPSVAEHLATVVRPRREAVGTQTEAGRQWGVSQSHLSQIERGAGCGIAVLLTLRDRLDLSLEDLCFPPGKRKGASKEDGQQRLDLDAVRAALRAELEEKERRDSRPPKKGPSDAPSRPRRR